jgi:hypothetical protein
MASMAQSIGARLDQGLRHLVGRRVDSGISCEALEQLPPTIRAAFWDLHRFDQRHLICVHQRLREQGVADHDVLLAGLLHDVGKVSFRVRPGSIDRALKVLLARFAPGLLSRVTASPRRWNRGLYVAVHHPRLGAERLRALGANERVCWLVARHEDAPEVVDAALRVLQEADCAC